MGEEKTFVADSYEIESDNIRIEVHIIERKTEFVREYFLNIPEYGPGTKALLENLRNSLISESTIDTEKLLDAKMIERLKEKFSKRAEQILKREMPSMTQETMNVLIGVLLHEMLGLGHIEFLLADPNLEEIVVNHSREPIWIYHKKFGWLRTNIVMKSEEETLNYASIIARRVGKQITSLNPLLDAHLVSGDRANATLFPVSSKGNTITIRRFRRDPWTVTDFLKAKTVTSDLMALIWFSIQYELNVILSGGTASGKTSFMNICLPFMQPNHRIITIEDSVSGDSEIVFEHNGIVEKSAVSELVDALIEDDSIKDIVLENTEGIKIPSVSKSGLLEWREPSHFIRHWVKKDLLKVTLKSGKQIEVTPDHSLFSLGNDGRIRELSGSEVKNGTWLAVPRILDWQGSKVVFDLKNNLSAFNRCFVKSLEIEPLIRESRKEMQCIFGKNNVNRSARVGKARVEMLLQLQNFPSTGFICSRFGTKLPFEVEIDEELACFVGLWLADGCYDKNSVLISVVEPEARQTVYKIAERFGISPKLHSDGVTLMLNSIVLKKFFENVLELRGNAFTKKIPSWAFRLGKKEAAALLKGYFSGDGWVRKNDIVVCSSSKQLLKDVQTMLLRFEIPLRVKWNLRRDKTFEARISGTGFLRTFVSEIGFTIHKKQQASQKWLSGKSHDVSDIVPLPKHFYKEIKKALKKEVGISRTYKAWKSWNYRKSNIGRKNLQSIIQRYSSEIQQVLHELAFNDLFWDRVEKIERRNFEGFVYDFSVPENENFVCNNTLCHNTRELQLPAFLHWVPLTTREPNAEGKGEVTMLDLLVNSLRMRPDRIIVGEVRRQREAEVMFEAMHTGHSVYTTLHADTAEETIRRLTNPPINIPKQMLNAVHLNVVMFRNRRLGIRRVLQVAEFVPERMSSGDDTVKPNVLFRWRAADDNIVKQNEPVVLREELSLHTGLFEKEIQKEIETKKKILEWMSKQDIHKVEDVGKVMASYYLDPEMIEGLAEKSLQFRVKE